mmetsp:Transcript_64361/g.88396  ORF Transcript_64361/g.88396 Transcript_64361/m.88396 type:complete len:217 (-) Transcript_64361:814-1464(-)
MRRKIMRRNSTIPPTRKSVKSSAERVTTPCTSPSPVLTGFCSSASFSCASISSPMKMLMMLKAMITYQIASPKPSQWENSMISNPMSPMAYDVTMKFDRRHVTGVQIDSFSAARSRLCSISFSFFELRFGMKIIAPAWRHMKLSTNRASPILPRLAWICTSADQHSAVVYPMGISSMEDHTMPRLLQMLSSSKRSSPYISFWSMPERPGKVRRIGK